MFTGIQIAGMLFGLVMLYLCHLYYRRGDLGTVDFSLWAGIWVLYLYAVLFPQTLNFFLETLGIQGAMHLFTIASFMVSFAVIFHLYRTTRRLQRKIEKLVTALAHEKR